MDDELTPLEEEQQEGQDQTQHLGPRFEYPPVGEMPIQQQQQAQPQPQQSTPSPNRFRDTARQLGRTGAQYSREAKDGLKDALPRGAEFVDGATGKERGIRKKDFTSAFDKKGLGKQAEGLGKAALDVPKKSAQATASNAKRMGKFAKNKKWFAAGGAGMAFLIPIALFFMWLMLFKNVHIKNMYVTYRWAQFNRGLNKVLAAQLKYAENNPDAKAKGSADTQVSPDDPIDKLASETNSDFSPDNIDPDNPDQVKSAADDLTRMGQSPEGVNGEVQKSAGGDFTIDPVNSDGDTPESRATSAEDKAGKGIDKEISDVADLDKNAPESLRPGVEEAQNSDKPPAEALNDGATKVLEGTGLGKVFRTFGTTVFISTMYCIFSDLWTSGKEQLAKIAVNTSIVTAQELDKTASCQQQGKCDLAQISAMSKRYDNGSESFTESCGAARAQQTSTEGCKEIDPKFKVNGLAEEIGGKAGLSIKTADALLDPPFRKIAGKDVCSLLMNPVFQGAQTAGEIALIVGTGGGWEAVGKGVAAGAATAAGTAGGKALIATFIAKYTGAAYRTLTPTDNGNVTDMGHLAAASAATKEAGGVQVTPQQFAQLDREYRAERVAANSKRSIVKKFFDNDSPDSVLSRVVINTPASPAAAIGRIKNVFAAITNPVKLNLALGKNSLAIIKPQTAYAADTGGDYSGAEVYGLQDGLFAPPVLMSDASSYEQVVEWGKTADFSAIESTLSSQCKKGSSYQDTITAKDQDKGACLWDKLTPTQKMYKQYKYIQRATYDNALRLNNQSDLSGGDNSSSGAQPAESGVSAKKGVDTSDPNKYPCPAGAARSIGETIQKVKIGLCDLGGNIRVNASAADAYNRMKIKAATAGFNLTASSSYREYTKQVELRKQHCGTSNYAIYEMRSGDCHPPTARPGTSLHEEGLAVDFVMTSGLFEWFSKNAGAFGIKNLPSERWHWSVTGG